MSWTFRLRQLANYLTNKIAFIYLIYAIVFGSIFIAVIPPFSNPDERSHLFRAFQLSEGTLNGESLEKHSGGMLPRVLGTACAYCPGTFTRGDAIRAYKLSLKLRRNWFDLKSHYLFLRKVLQSNRLTSETIVDREFQEFPYAVTYSPIPFIPQIIGVWIGRFAELPVLAIVYVGRFLNLMTGVGIIFTAIYLFRGYQAWPLFLFGTTPMVIQLFSSLSPDAFAISLSALCVALGFYFRRNPSELFKVRGQLILLMVSLALGFTKFAYFLQPSILYVMVYTRIRYSRIRWLTFFSTVLCPISACLLWTSLSLQHIKLIRPFTSPTFQHQSLSLFNQPLHFVNTVLKTIKIEGLFYVESFIGRLGSLNVSLPKMLVFFYAALMLLAPVLIFRKKGESETLLRSESLIALGLFSTSILVILIIGYVGWTSTLSPTILGIQGRYFLPCYPLLLAGLCTRQLNLRLNTSVALVSTFAPLTMLGIASILLMQFFFTRI